MRTFRREGISCIKVYNFLCDSYKMVGEYQLRIEICIILFVRGFEMTVKLRQLFISGLLCIFAFLIIHFVGVIHSNILLGIGLEQNERGQYYIAEADVSSEGYKQNLREGDILLRVNGKPIDKVDEAVRYGSLTQVQSVDLLRNSKGVLHLLCIMILRINPPYIIRLPSL